MTEWDSAPKDASQNVNTWDFSKKIWDPRKKLIVLGKKWICSGRTNWIFAPKNCGRRPCVLPSGVDLLKNDREFGQLKKTAIACRKKHGFITLGNVTFSCQFYVCCLTVITNSSSNYGKLPWTCRFGTTDREQGIGVFVSELFSISLLTIDNIYIHDSANFPNIITIDGVESHVLLVS